MNFATLIILVLVVLLVLTILSIVLIIRGIIKKTVRIAGLGVLILSVIVFFITWVLAQLPTNWKVGG